MSPNNSLTKKQEGNTFSTFLTSEGAKNKINQIIGGKDGQRFMTAILAAVSDNPKLAKCEHGSILSAALIGESLKLSPSRQLGQYFIIPYGDKAEFQIGYKGYIQLALRSGYYKKLNALAIKEGELVYYNPLTEDFDCKLIEDDEIREKTATSGYYVMFEYLNGFCKTMYWSVKKMKSHAVQYSQAYKSDLKNKSSYSFWITDFDSQGLKTMLRQIISKWGIMSIEIQKAFEEDKDEAIQADYVDTTPEQPKPDKTIQAAFFEGSEKPKEAVTA